MSYFTEDPGIANGGTTNHNAIHTITVLILQRFLCAVDIAVTKDGNMYTRIVFYFGYKAPVGLAFIQLAAGAAMNGERFYTYILQAFSHLFYLFGLIIPTKPGLYSNR